MPSLSCVHKLLQIKSSWMIEMSHIESPSLHVRRFGGRAVPKSFCARSPESTKFWPSIGEGKQSVDIWGVYGWSFLRDCFGWIQECWTKHYLVLKMCSSCFWKDCQCLSSIVDVMLLFWMWCFLAISAWNWTIKFASIGTMPMAWAQIDETLVWFYISSNYILSMVHRTGKQLHYYFPGHCSVWIRKKGLMFGDYLFQSWFTMICSERFRNDIKEPTMFMSILLIYKNNLKIPRYSKSSKYNLNCILNSGVTPTFPISNDQCGKPPTESSGCRNSPGDARRVIAQPDFRLWTYSQVQGQDGHCCARGSWWIWRAPQENTLQWINISPKRHFSKMMFLFPRWDMLSSWRVPMCSPNALIFC